MDDQLKKVKPLDTAVRSDEGSRPTSAVLGAHHNH